jgi:formamidopyrimidine-DNA glycosylase
MNLEESIAHGKLLRNHFVQEKLTHDTTGCKVDVYGFGNTTPMLCDPYVLISSIMERRRYYCRRESYW